MTINLIALWGAVNNLPAKPTKSPDNYHLAAEADQPVADRKEFSVWDKRFDRYASYWTEKYKAEPIKY